MKKDILNNCNTLMKSLTFVRGDENLSRYATRFSIGWGTGILPRLFCSPSLTKGLGTASQISSVEEICSGVRIPLRYIKTAHHKRRTVFTLLGDRDSNPDTGLQRPMSY